MTATESKSLRPVRSLDPSYYTDPAIYQQELSSLLSQTWQFAAHASQLSNSGDYVTFKIAEQSLFSVCDQDGMIRTFYNVCQHRAHELVQGNGNCAKLIKCPYHAWTYRLDGRLLKGPNIDAVPEFPSDQICLASVSTEVLCGFVFVNLDPNAKPMGVWFPGIDTELRAFVPQIDQLKPLQWIRVKERCNWKVSVENYSECYHCRINHRTFATGVVKPDTYDIQPQGYCLRHTTECQNLDRMSYPIDLDANEHAGDYSSWFLWPLFSFQVYPGNVLNTYHWQPINCEEVEVCRGWYTVDGEDSQVIRGLALQDCETTVEEDIRLVESVQRGLNSRGYRPGPLVIDPAGGVNSEHSIEVLHQWMRDGLNIKKTYSEPV